jgi:hypothetical protein
MKAWINGFFAGWVSGYICIYMRNSSFGRRDDVNSITRPGCIYLYVVVQRSFSGKRFCQLLSARAHGQHVRFSLEIPGPTPGIVAVLQKRLCEWLHVHHQN